MHVQHRSQLSGLTAFAGDETKILESIGKEGTKVLFAIGDASAGHDLSVAEACGSRVFFGIDLIHARPPQQIICCSKKSYIGAAGAIMEFCGRGNECLGRVKAATENQIVMNTTATKRAIMTVTSCNDATTVVRSLLRRANVATPRLRDALLVRHINVCGRLSTTPQFMFDAGPRNWFGVSGVCAPAKLDRSPMVARMLRGHFRSVSSIAQNPTKPAALLQRSARRRRARPSFRVAARITSRGEPSPCAGSGFPYRARPSARRFARACVVWIG